MRKAVSSLQEFEGYMFIVPTYWILNIFLYLIQVKLMIENPSDKRIREHVINLF